MTLRIELKGRIELSSNAEKVSAEIEEAVKVLNEFLEKAAEKFGEEEVARLLSCVPGDKEVKLVIASGRSVRAHDALLRFKNVLAQKIGVKKVGVRRIFVDDLEVRVFGDHGER